MRFPVIAAAALGLSACATSSADFGREPGMSAVGSGLVGYHESLPTAVFPVTKGAGDRSLWNAKGARLYRDPRAATIGDVLTVKIFINDRATLDNSSDRSRDSKAGAGLKLGFDLNGSGSELGADGKIDAQSSSRGRGSIDRSEQIQLSVAAVVTDVLPNGNLLISGTQEVRVNFELRVLNIAGIVRPSDISNDNMISYEKIAEARISYGGRGRITEVQQPGYGQQLYDIVAPF